MEKEFEKKNSLYSHTYNFCLVKINPFKELCNQSSNLNIFKYLIIILLTEINGFNKDLEGLDGTKDIRKKVKIENLTIFKIYMSVSSIYMITGTRIRK